MKLILFFYCFLNCFFQIYNFLFYLTHLLIYLILKINCNILIFLITIYVLNYSSYFTKSIVRTFRIIINILVGCFFFWTLKIFLWNLLNHFFRTIISFIKFWVFKHILLYDTSWIYFSINNLLVLDFTFTSFWFFPASLLFLYWISLISSIRSS
jgi:hypothetical protein